MFSFSTNFNTPLFVPDFDLILFLYFFALFSLSFPLCSCVISFLFFSNLPHYFSKLLIFGFEIISFLFPQAYAQTPIFFDPSLLLFLKSNSPQDSPPARGFDSPMQVRLHHI